MKYVGIDLGTTNSAICSYDGEKIHLYKSPEQHDVTPSAIFIDRRGNKYVGSRAYNSAAKNPDNAAVLFKRLMGTSTPVKLPAVNLSMTPLIVEVNALDNNPRIIATQQDRVFLGNGDLAYVKDADPGKENWHVYRNGKPLLDPEDDKQVLGYEAFYLGTARQVRPGEPATFEIRTAKQEIGRGDRLIPATRPALVDYIPHRPDTQIDGRIISIYGGVGSAGRGSIVSFNRGAQDGLEIGHVLALQRNRTVYERDQNDRRISVKIPSERIGLIFVFRTFERISYALVLQSEGTVEINDYVQTP